MTATIVPDGIDVAVSYKWRESRGQQPFMDHDNGPVPKKKADVSAFAEITALRN
jgi:hypothetical protein